MDEPSACLYSTYLNGANLWVLPNDYIVRTGQEPENKLTMDEVSKLSHSNNIPNLVLKLFWMSCSASCS